MSKTIEIVSIHKGNVNLTVKGEPRKILFQDKGDVGYAVVDHDEAAVLLKLGLPDFWKPGAKNQADTDINADSTSAEHTETDPNTDLKDALKDTDAANSENSFNPPFVTKHKGGGRWQVLDSLGAVVEEGLAKEEAENKAIELNTTA